LKRKNLVVLHLESIAWQAFNAFPEAFPNLNRVMPAARVFRWYFSSATSTQMVLAYLFHGNDLELDAATSLSEPAQNNPSLFAILQAAGYRTAFLCVTAWGGGPMLPLLAGTLPPVWSTNDFAELLRKFEALTAAPPFAIYVWNLVTHIEHALALAPHAGGVDDLLGGACAVADHALGSVLDILAARNLMDDTTVVIFGDHGDDYWTHGFKGGLLHAM
jgi:phosphoglycerol transferase MdoB-like AlkP superfamily enzyme